MPPTRTVTWSITSGSEFASADANGLVTANGTVTVRATSVANGERHGEIEITVNYAIAVQEIIVATEGVPAEITKMSGTGNCPQSIIKHLNFYVVKSFTNPAPPPLMYYHKT